MDSMIFYRSFYEAIKDLPSEEFKKCMTVLMEYAFYGNEPETDGIEKTVFILAKPQIDKNNQRYMSVKKRRTEANQTETETEPNINQKETDTASYCKNTEPNVNDNDNVNDNLNENENVNANGNGKKEPKLKKSGACAPVCSSSRKNRYRYPSGFVDVIYRQKIRAELIKGVSKNNTEVRCYDTGKAFCQNVSQWRRHDGKTVKSYIIRQGTFVKSG